MLEQRVEWTERKRTVIVIGIRGEVPMPHLDPKKPILKTVETDQAVFGYELWNSLGLAKGDKIAFNGQTLTISECKPQIGNKDDISLWIPLNQAQTMLGHEGLVTGILALECECAWADLPLVRQEITAVLPGTQVLEETGKALARAEARNRAYEAKVETLEAEASDRQRQRAQRGELA
jgi:hypothetical protein